jgi:hypothetical protein
MKMKTLNILAAGIVVGLAFTGSAQAAPVLCESSDRNHMFIDDLLVSACLDAGTGNLTGNPKNDLFLTGVGEDYDSIGAAQWTQPGDGNTGTFSFAPTTWNSFGQIAIGFKFGTGDQADEWFVYALNPAVSSGDWEFVNVFGRGGGLSHVNLYGTGDPVSVPEPTTVGLFALGLVGLGVAARRRRTSA